MIYDQQKLDQFQKENGMSLDEAWNHVKEWNLSGKKSEAIRGCEEIVKFFPDHEAKSLLNEANASPKSQSFFEKAGSNLADKMVGAIDNIKKKHENPSQDGSIQSESAEINKKAENDFEQKIIEAKEHVTTNDERLWAAVSYAWIVVLFPLLFKRYSVYIQFHAKQGLVLFLLLYLFDWIIGGIFTVIGLGFLNYVLPILYIPLLFFMAFQAYSGKWLKFPGVWSLAKKINL